MSADQVQELAKLVGVSVHPNSCLTLFGINKYVNDCSTSSELLATSHLRDCSLGALSSGNEKVDDAIRVLRLIHTERQRMLQTKINEALSRVQKITGNPKADLKIGRVGR